MMTGRTTGGMGQALAFAAAAMAMGVSFEPPGRETWNRSVRRAPKPTPPAPTAKRAKVKAARKANTKRNRR